MVHVLQVSVLGGFTEPRSSTKSNSSVALCVQSVPESRCPFHKDLCNVESHILADAEYIKVGKQRLQAVARRERNSVKPPIAVKHITRLDLSGVSAAPSNERSHSSKREETDYLEETAAEYEGEYSLETHKGAIKQCSLVMGMGHSVSSETAAASTSKEARPNVKSSHIPPQDFVARCVLLGECLLLCSGQIYSVLGHSIRQRKTEWNGGHMHLKEAWEVLLGVNPTLITYHKIRLPADATFISSGSVKSLQHGPSML